MDHTSTYKLDGLTGDSVFFEFDGATLQIGRGIWERQGCPSKVYVRIPDVDEEG